jgi:uncharacterized cupin superfamily protein
VSDVSVIRSADRTGWTPLVDPPGEIPSRGAEITAFSSADGAFTCGLWSREPDTWSFERAHDEVALFLAGRAEMETVEGRTLVLGPGDILVTPNGSAGRWRIIEPITKFYAIYSRGSGSDTSIRVIHDGDPVDWVKLETGPDDPNPPGEEWYAYRSADGNFSTGVWRRVAETGPMDLGYHEVAFVLEGDVDVDAADGATVSVGRGDVLITPKGFSGTWRAKTSVRKFWAVHHE